MTASGGERRLRGDVRILDLRDAIDEKTVLDIGGRKALGRLELGERALVKLLLAGTDLRVGLRKFALGLLVQLMHLVGGGLLTLELRGELVELCSRVTVIGFVGLETGKHVDAARLRTMHRLAQLGKARHHVTALFLEQEHARVETVESRLAATTLLGYIACEQTLLLEQVLVLLELAVLLVDAETRELHERIGFLFQALGLAPAFLEPAQVIDGKRKLDGLEFLGELLVLTSTARLTLKRLELTVDLSRDIVHALELGVHVLELAGGTFLAFLVLEDARGLLDEQAAILGTSAQHVLQRALRDDRVRIAAEAGIVEDVEHVHETRWRAVDEVLALAAAIHAARDDDLIEIEGQRAIGVVEHEVDLGQADCLAGRRSGEDDVLHGLAAQLLGALLAQDP